MGTLEPTNDQANGDQIALIPVLPDDTTAVLQQRLARLHGGRAALALDARAHQLASVVRLDLLLRQAQRQGVELALVTRHLPTRAAAAACGLPVFGSLETAQVASPWRRPAPRLNAPPDRTAAARPPVRQAQRWLDWRRQRGTAQARNRRIDALSARGAGSAWGQALGLLLLAAVLGGAVLGVVLLTVPLATVTVVPSRQPVIASIDVRASPAVEQVDPTNNLVPARRIEVLVEETRSAPTTGRRDVPDKTASGVVTFVNLRSQEVLVPIGTVVRTTAGNNIRFKTTADVTISGGAGARADAPVEALDPGPSGNVAAGAINRIDGGLSVSLRVINQTPLRGGTVRQGGVVTLADKERLRTALQQQLEQKAYQKLSEELKEGEFVPPESVETYVMSLIFDSFTDEARDTLGVTMRILARAIAVDDQGGRTLGLRALQAQMTPGSHLLADSIQYGASRFTVLEENTLKVVTYNVTTSGVMVADVEQGRLRAAVAGLTPEAAGELLQREWQLEQPPRIELAPNWLGRLPLIPFRVHVRVDYASALATNP